MDFLAPIIILALTVGLVFRQFTGRDSGSTSRTDDGSGGKNEAFNSLGIKGSETTNQMKRKRSSEAIRSMETKTAYEYDVFLSFCGGDTRLKFTDNLYHRMKSAGICVFLDSEELKNGKEISDLLKAIDESRIYIPIFSKKFASRSWCLRELARMVDRHLESDGKREIIPIFYDVEPNDVKLITDLYNIDLLKHKSKKYRQSEEVDQWTIALKEVGSKMGRVLKGKREGEEIESIVKDVLGKLGKHVDLPRELVEDYRQIIDIIENLDLNSGGVRFVRMHGIGGVGKTTLAKIVFKKLCSHFDRVCFLNDIGKSSEHGLVTLQKKLLRNVGSSLQADEIQDIGDGMYWIEAVCKTKKVLIVLDDLDNDDQLEKLAGKSDWFGLGSRIIITTRNNCILKTQGESSSKEVLNQTKEIVDYEVHEMEINQALQLFYKHAFRSDSPIEGYAAVSKDIVKKVAMLPLAVVVVGSFLFRKGVVLEPQGNKRKLWEQTLKKLDRGPFKNVRDALMISYEGLENEEKEVFLDIACFFTNEDQTYPIIMWDDCNYYPNIAIAVLLEQSLIKIGDDNTFWMHDQIRDLGRYIVLEGYSCKEHSPKVSRVWTHEDAVKVLEGKEKNKHVEALSVTSSGYGRNFAAQELACLPHLRFLRVKGIDFSGNFDNLLSKLRWLSWQTCQMICNANDFHFSNLVVLNLSNSDIEGDWDGWSKMKLNKLKILDLTGCIRLKETPDFSNFTSLERLILARCVELTAIHSSIVKLRRLETLNIKGCSSLGELPPEIGFLESLTEIIMPQNIHPFKLPETFGNLQALSSLILDEHPGISQLPNSIGGLVKVRRLSLRRCVGIKKLPSTIGKMKILEELDLSKSGIDELPDSIGCLKELKVIRVSYTVIRNLPSTIKQVEMLEELHAKKCWYLMDENLEEIWKLSHLRILDLSYTEVSNFPTVGGCLSSLQTLEMSSSHLPEVRHLPPSLTRLHLQACHFPSILHFTSLVSLDYLELSRFSASTTEPGPTWTSDLREERLIHPLPSSLSTLKFRGINRLPPLSNLERLSVLYVIECPISGFSVSKDLIHLKELKLSKCKFLEKIPGLSLLKNLERLDLNGLESLVEIDGLSGLESLVYFCISHCGRIERLPGLSKLDKLRHIELEACPKIRAIKGLESLELNECGCTILKRLIDVSSSTWLSHRVPKNQVFLSFMGADACYCIVDRLCKILVHNQISVFVDGEESSSGDGIGEERPLDDSIIYIPFLSKNYASSGWRLRELAQMVECTSKSNRGKKILPILYDVEAEDIKLESDWYKGALTKHRRKFGNEVEAWEKALSDVMDMKGFNVKSKSQEELIDLVVEEVLCKLNAKRVDVPENLIGYEEHANAVIQRLDVDSGGVRLVAIHGMGGVGKTTLAKVVFNLLFSHYDGVCFLNDVRESSRHGLINLLKKLLSGFVGSVIANQIEDIEGGMNWIKSVCEIRKVLVVLDNVWTEEQLENLVKIFDWFGSGSRIIITTRNRYLLLTLYELSSEEDQNQSNVLALYELSSEEDQNQSNEIHIYHFYELVGRDKIQALRLFCNHAFKRDSPPEGYVDLAERIVKEVGRHTLLVEVIGSYLYCHGYDLEPHGDKITQLWENTWKQLCQVPSHDVLGKLSLSYEGLDYKQKEVFLDIACFFTNKDQTYPVIMWDDCSYHPHSAIRVLRQLSLIKVTNDSKFWMHDIVRDLGRSIIRRESLHKFSRAWDPEEAMELLGKKERNEDLQALGLTYGGWIRIMRHEELAALPNLRFLRTEGIDFVGNFGNLLSELRWLSWQTWQATFRANNFHFNNLLVLDLSHSNIEDGWGGWSQMKMNRLKVLDLTSCRELKNTPDFSNFLTLEMLILSGCVNLTTIDSSIGKLTLLRTLNIKGCSCLREFPAEFGSLECLKEIIMSRDSQLFNLPGKFSSLVRRTS